MQFRRALIAALFLSIGLCLTTYNAGGTRGFKSKVEPGIGTLQQGQDKNVGATTGAFGDQGFLPTVGNYANTSMALSVKPFDFTSSLGRKDGSGSNGNS